MTNNKKAPCKNCADRNVGCHGICKDYMEWCADQKRIKEWEKETMPPVINRYNFIGSGFPNKIRSRYRKGPKQS
jgi:hypothetical protein